MNRKPLLVVLLFAGLFMVSSAQAQQISSHLEVFKPFVGKTWKGTFAGSTPDNPAVDVQKWEWALNGQAIRIMHSLNDGEYGGELIIMWDPEQQVHVYHYFTTAGFFTKGTMRWEGDQIVSHEYVTGNENGVTEVRSTSQILPDGRLKGISQYLKNGEWIEGHQVEYVEDPSAQVVFKN